MNTHKETLPPMRRQISGLTQNNHEIVETLIDFFNSVHTEELDCELMWMEQFFLAKLRGKLYTSLL